MEDVRKNVQSKTLDQDLINGSTALVIDDEQNLVKSIKRLLRRYGVDCLAAYSGEEGIDILEKHAPVDAVFLDIKMPGMDGMEVLDVIKKKWSDIPVIMMTAYATVELAVEAMKKGAMDFISKPFDHDEIIPVMLAKAVEHNRLLHKCRLLQGEVEDKYRFENLVGTSKAMRDIFKKIARLAENESTVLISGESGTGKELIARAIHYNSPRRKGPFVAVDLGALTENVVESELFGHVKGSFTGAQADHKGLFRVADGGTILLDEVGEIPPHVQARLLRVLQEREVKPVGSTRSVKVNVRVLAATNKRLKEMVSNGSFREDLYYRLNVVPLDVPPLRERKEDIPLLIEHLMRKYLPEGKRLSFTSEAIDSLCRYSWPGNVRELENCIQQIIAVRDSEKPVTVFDLPEEIRHSAREKEHELSLNSYEKMAIQKALESCGGNIEEAADMLGVGKSTLYRKMKQYEIPRPRKNNN